MSAKAAEMGARVVVAVAGAAGELVAARSMDGAYPASFDIAVNKAFTAAGLKMPTSALAGLAAPGGPLYGIGNTNGGRIVIFGGGETLAADGGVVGGIGVSGGTLEQDTHLGLYGKSLFESGR